MPSPLVLVSGALLLAAAPSVCDLQTERLLRGQEVLEARLVALQHSLAAIQAALRVCPGGWTGHGDSCFRLFSEELTADSAAEACRERDPRARLASLGNDTREFVHDLVDNSEHKQMWIGLRRTEAGWRWSDGRLLGEDGAWLRYQPDNNGGEDCVMYDRTERYPGWTKGWSDERCVLTAPFICQISLGCPGSL